MTDYQTILIDTKAGVATIPLNRPEQRTPRLGSAGFSQARQG